MNGRKDIRELLAIARYELAHNPSITVYSMHDGREIHRRYANPLARLGLIVDEAADLFRRLGETFESAFGPFVAAMNAWAADISK